MNSKPKSLGLYLSNQSNKDRIIEQIECGSYLNNYLDINILSGALFSSLAINRFIDEELRHDKFHFATNENIGLQTMSSGQQRKALLAHIIIQNPQYIILDDVYSSIDLQTQQSIVEMLNQLSTSCILIQMFYRKRDLLDCIDHILVIDSSDTIVSEQLRSNFLATPEVETEFKMPNLSHVLKYDYTGLDDTLLQLNHVSAAYDGRVVLRDISWTVKKGEFWQLIGPNGSGKSTLLSMIIGDNPRGYGQDMCLFGRKKGSGETIWDIKRHIGYFTPAMTFQFTHGDTVENMIISGMVDSVGLYVIPSDLQRRVANAWVNMLGDSFRNKLFNALSPGQQRIVLAVRAMVKYPPLLILDEPTVGLDDENAALFISLVNAIAREQKVAIIYVSHRDEPLLNPSKIYELVSTADGSVGIIRSTTI